MRALSYAQQAVAGCSTMSIDIGPMGDGEHDDRVGLLIQRVNDAVGTSPGCPATLELEAKWLAEAFRIGRDSRQQFDDRRRVTLR